MKEPLPQDKLVGELAKDFNDGVLTANPEYQRGVVWDDTQIRMFLDSVLRRHYMPLIYLRELPGNRYEIIDGQQRINALWGFIYDKQVVESKRKSRAKNTDGFETSRRRIPQLFDPKMENSLFPKFLQEQDCAWAGKRFADFSSDLQQEFKRRSLTAVIIDGDDEETRDMFIRLQGGTALEKQEIRDCWPGDFCEFVINIGGKTSLGREGHKFFSEVFPRPSPNRGEVRQLVAQAFSLLLFRNEYGNDKFCSIQAETLDNRYRKHVSMREQDDKRQQEQFNKILDVLHHCFNGEKISPQLSNNDFIHLALLADSLLNDYSSSWEYGLIGAFKQWRIKVKEVKKLIKEQAAIPPELRPIGAFINSGGPSADKIRGRFEIFEPEMRKLLGGYLHRISDSDE